MMAFLKSGDAAAKKVAPATLWPRANATPEQLAARKEALALPGFKPLAAAFGEALAAMATGVLLEVGGKQSVMLRRRIDNVWQSAEPFPGDAGLAVVAAVKKLAGPLAAGDGGEQAGEFIVVAGGVRRPCRLTVRQAGSHEQVLLQIGGELPPQESAGLAGMLGRIVPGLKPKASAGTGGVALPSITFAGDRGASLEGLEAACQLVAAAVAGRAGEILIEANRDQGTVHHDVDGVWRPAVTLGRQESAAVMAVFNAVAGLEGGKRRSGRADLVIEGKTWPCTVSLQAVPTGTRLSVALEYGRPKLKTLADTGMSDPRVQQVKELVALESGVLVISTPKRGGLSTLFDGVLTAADRMLRDFVSFEDAAAPRTEIQNVRPMRWDAAAGISPVAAVDQALREYPRVLVSCDLKDPELAQRLVAQAAEGLLVIVGIRGADAADGIANLAGLGIGRDVLGRLLLGSIGGRLVRKLCPKCRDEYLPTPDDIAKLKLDPGSRPTLYRATQGGCGVCAQTGYLGRTGIFEVATGRTVNHAVAAGADAAVIRQAAAKDGMQPLSREARRLVTEGVTSLDEIQRIFRKG
jgi:type II secretory ATPase GspE/PulE/Tfp pilus assembly ATPase PilB-like protein